MRILTREQLLNEPSGTVYTTYITNYVNGELHIKVGNNCNLELIPTHDYGTEEDVNRQTNWSTDDLNIIADYDKNQLFAVYSKSEVMKMINCLSWALSGCDDYFDMDEVYCESGVVYRDPEWMPYDWEVRIVASDKIKLTTNESDDYTVLHYEDFFREGHRIDNDDWIDLLKYLGYEVECKEISDEKMERMT